MGLLDNSDLAGGAVGLLGTVYNMYTNKRDFDYQKALQQQMFQREDTAVQRRMEDLKAAGLNPNLAAGSAAGAGAVVSRSNTNDVNMGSALDMMQAVNNIRQQKQQTENAKIENSILKAEDYIKDNEKYVSMANTLAALGVPFQTKIFQRKDGSFSFYVGTDGKGTYYSENSPLQKALDYQMQNMKNSADLLQKDNDWYTADKISGLALSLLPNLNFSFGKKLK